MANYTAADVKKLRELTGAGMLDCKNALVEADGDVEKAVEQLRIKGQKGVAKREGRDATNGAVVSLLEGGNSGVLVELNCETDFVAKGGRFVEVANALAAHVAKTSPADIETALASEINPGQTVQQFVDEANANLGEKIVFRRFAQFTGGAFVAAYMHRTDPDLPPAIGVLVELDQENAEIAKDVAQHIAAFAPKYLSREDIPAEDLDNERRIAEATAREEGKPDAALPRIVEGRVTGFVKENSVLEQAFAKDNKKTVQKVLDEAGVKLVRFARFRVGA
ncbi:translation elongation factor Ts [Streptacidiphilus sp. P02-A3a]|uniref:translation elongation factor Ts n=1 Tax=Streptacidiphilus sp. P02-A3a TaxID=2704468 RepID=UPI0015FC14CC|nr:translation elongation factor Ts [Streptacidiphilus sp. P02-A3a]QMU72319.1 elongation factor Ts [Streptacidiphilus sp. P02-A3a]